MYSLYGIAAVIHVLLLENGSAFVCDKHASTCETSLEIATSLTMFHETEKAVFPNNGLLYRYDVTNTSSATPINNDEVITADGLGNAEGRHRCERQSTRADN
jgi:hypothetical protein